MTTCLMWPYFNVPFNLEGHIRQVWLYRINSFAIFISTLFPFLQHKQGSLRNYLPFLRNTWVFCGACVAQTLVFCVVFCRSFFVLFVLAILLSVLQLMATCLVSSNSYYIYIIWFIYLIYYIYYLRHTFIFYS